MAQINRLRSAEISNGNVIDADDINAELNNIVGAYNVNDLTLTDVTSNAVSLAGVKTFTSSPKMNGIDERTAGSGVTVDGALLKDGMIVVSGTPVANGGIGYVSNQFKGYRNGTLKSFLMEGDHSYKWVLARSSNTMWDSSVLGAVFLCTSTFTQTIDASANLGSGWFCYVRNDGTGIITIDPNGSETIDGLTTMAVYPGESFTVVCDGSNFKTIGRRKGLVLMNSATASSSATVDFSNLLTDTEMKEYEIHLQDFKPATDNVSLLVRFGTGGTPTWDSTAGHYMYASSYSSSGDTTYRDNSSSSATALDVAPGVGNGATESANGIIHIFNPAGTTNAKHITSDISSSLYSATDNPLRIAMSGMWNQTTAATSVRLLFASGNIASGTAQLWGVRI